jgi:outer membrane protein insertion porin family
MSIAVALIWAASVHAQGMGPGGLNSIPSTLFGSQKKTEPEASGPTLSATDETVADVRIAGNKTIPTSQVLNQLQTRAGRPFDPALVQRDVRKLATRGWFVDVQPTYEQASNGRVVIFTVVERPVIRYVEYLGNSGIRDKKLTKETDLKVGGPVDPYAVEEARRRMLTLYRESGFNNAQITILEGNEATDQGIVFVINEGERQKVWKVVFEGNQFATDRRLRTQIESKPPLMMVFKGFVDLEKIDGDVERLTNYYRSFGYFQAKVGRKLEYDDDDQWLTLRFVIHEGPRYQVRSVSFIGNKIFAGESLAMGVKLLADQPFEQAVMNGDVQWLKELYGSQGYVFADIRAEPIFLEEPGQLDLMYHIEEGKRWRVGNIYVHIDGDTPHTRIQTALNRLSIRPGQIVDIREVKASERRLQASGLFMSDPTRGVAPKITYRIQELGDTELATDMDHSEFRGQSPDPLATPRASLSVPPPSVAPLLPPPGVNLPSVATMAAPGPLGSATFYPPQRTRTLRVQPPSDFAERDDQIDVHLSFDDREPAADPELTPQAIRHEVRRYPYDSGSPANPYQKFVVRTQSPYQAPTTPAYPPPGATPPQSYSAPQAGAPTTFSPPPPPQYGTPQPYGAPPVQYGPAQPLPPDPRIAPATPLPTNPQLFPTGQTDPFAPQYSDPAVDLFVDLNETQTGRLMLGVAVNSDAGLVGQILLDEQNFDWKRYPRSMDELMSGRAWRGAGQRFRLEAAPGTEVQRYLASFQEPYLWDTPVSLGLSGSYFDRRYVDWDEQRLGGRVSLGYQWTENDLSAAIAYRGENVKISNISAPIPELTEVLGDNALHGFKFTIANDTRDSAFLATQGHYLEFSVEQVIGSFEYPRAIIEGRQYFLMRERPDHSGRHVLSASTRLGFTGDNTPIYENFFAGGFSTLRGFDFRGASPVKSGVQVGGEFMWVNTVEYLFPLTADDMIHGVVFTDFGTVEENVTINDFRVAPGFGLRITVPAMGPAPIALDFAFPVLKADPDDEQMFSFNIGLQR